MKNRLFAILVFLFAVVQSHAQQTEIGGRVVSADNTPLNGVTVQVKGAANATRTDADGRFRIRIPDNNATLVFSFVGMETVTYTVSAVPTPVVLKDASNALSDVVVVGYGTQKRRDLTGSVASASMTDMMKAPVASFDQALAGRVAGVQVTASDGQPGAGINIVIRGANSVTQANSPLYVVDGFPIESPDNNTINPADIESIEVLKDASATAIYGARGANGVIMITTKKGKTGAPVVAYNGYYGIQQNSKRMQVLSPSQYVQYQLEANPSTAAYVPGSYPTPRQLFLSGGTTLDYYKDTAAFLNYQDQLFQTAPMLSNSISLTGGNDKTKYAVSGNIFNQKGIIVTSNYKRYQGRVVLDQKVSEKLKVGINANYSYLMQSGLSVGGSNYSGTLNLMYSAWGFRPVNPSPVSVAALAGNFDLSDESTTDPTVSPTNDYRFNPLKSLKNTLNNNITRELMTNAYAEYKIIPELTLRVTGGIVNRLLVNQLFYNSQTAQGSPAVANSAGPNGSILNNSFNSWLNENYLTYNKTFNKVHSLNIMGGFSQQQVNTSSNGFSAVNVPNESLGINALSQGTIKSTTSLASVNGALSFLGRVNYGYKSKYLFTASYRADGSSKFAPGNRWGYFPTGAVAWRFSQEDFMKKLSTVITDGKLRVSYGLTGNNRVSDFPYLPAYSQTNSAAPYTFNNTSLAGAVPTTIGNLDLKWETTAQWDVGLDLGITKFATLTADYYRKITSNLLLNAAVPTSSGYATAFKNIGKISNEGFEFALNTNNIRTQSFSWTSSFNISFNRNKVLQLAEGQESLFSFTPFDTKFTTVPSYIAKVGQPLGLMYGLVTDGVYQYSDFDKTSAGGYILRNSVTTNGNTRSAIQPGDIKYKDINGDKIIDANDMTVIGSSLPKHIGGFNNNFTYKGFDLNVFFQWSYGNDVQNMNNYTFRGGSNSVNQFESFMNRWTPDNMNTNIVRTNGFAGSYTAYSGYTIEDGSYLRLKTLSLGYSLTPAALRRLKIKSMRIYTSMQNVFTWTKYSGQDPEVNLYNSVLTGGFDYSSYPKARVTTLGVNVNF
ncbi:MAG: TonB-dependent receptor [Niabella sp.]|nr:TonB-dependent receptor [Niabella sp.]